VHALFDRHAPPEIAALLRRWLATAPDAFRVARGRAGDVAGVIGMCERRTAPARLVDDDPVARVWREDLRRDPVRRDDLVLYTRCLLSRDAGEGQSDAQAALWIDAKRSYMQLRPALRRMYVSFADPEAYLPILGPLGFTRVRDGAVEVGEIRYQALRLDFGPRSVDGWLARLVAGETEADDELILDAPRRELRVGEHRAELTALEIELVSYLLEHEGQPVRRADLRRDVWGDDWQGGSNVVDVAVGGIRRKLGPHAALLETVRGVGYRLRADAVAPSSAP
jgi:DNA-binding winged helix-turn-helix (wHTH) protein